MSFQNGTLTAWLLFIMIGGFFYGPNLVYGQDAPDVDWKYPVPIPQYHKDSRAPFLVADRAGTIHGLTIDTGDGKVLAYRSWTEDVGWTIPIDVALPPAGGSAVILGASIDNKDILHVVVFYGSLDNSGIYYTSVPIAFASSANRWNPMKLIVPGAGPTAQGFFTTFGDGRLNVIFQGMEAGLGIYEVFSSDGGETWSNAEVVYLAPGDLFQPSAIDMHAGVNGDLHAVWSLWNAEQGVGEQIIYSQKSAETGLWSRPVVIAERDETDYESDWAAVTTIDDRILILYQDDRPATKYMRFSPNDGRYWSEPQRVWPHVGEYENAVFLKDNEGGLHAILGNRFGDCCHGMWYSKYEDGQWSNLQSLIQGPKTIDFDPSAPSAVITQGNLLMASWWMDSSDRNGAWYSYGYLEDLEASPAEQLIIPSEDTIVEENSTENLLDPSLEETNNNQIPEDQKIQEQVTSPARPMTIGIIASVIGLLLGFAIWFILIKLR